MKNFKKRAIFAAMMGALSSVSAFAMENEKKEQKEQKYRTIDNANLFQHKNISQDKRIMFLDKNNPNLNLTQDELEKIFKQMAEIHYISFDYGGIIKTRRELEENLKYFARTKNIPKRDTTEVFNPTLYKKKQKKVNERKNREMKIVYDRLKNEYNTGMHFMLYKDQSENKIEGYIAFKPEDQSGSVYVDTLANKHSRVGGPMIREMQRKFSNITLIPLNSKAYEFYKHMGFSSGRNMQMEWSKKQKIKFK